MYGFTHLFFDHRHLVSVEHDPFFHSVAVNAVYAVPQ
jgi:hypothetical protein